MTRYTVCRIFALLIPLALAVGGCASWLTGQADRREAELHRIDARIVDAQAAAEKATAEGDTAAADSLAESIAKLTKIQTTLRAEVETLRSRVAEQRADDVATATTAATELIVPGGFVASLLTAAAFAVRSYRRGIVAEEAISTAEYLKKMEPGVAEAFAKHATSIRLAQSKVTAAFVDKLQGKP